MVTKEPEGQGIQKWQSGQRRQINAVQGKWATEQASIRASEHAKQENKRAKGEKGEN
jgi:hypothetical protein